MNWFPLRNLTHYSLLRGFSKPEEIVAKCKDNDYIACGICDYKTLSGAVSFYKECKSAGIKPIIGCSFDKFVLFAKNKDGWHDLIKIVSSIGDDGYIEDSFLESILNKNNIIKLLDAPNKSIPISYYANKEDAKLHRILLCSDMKTTLPKISKTIRPDNRGGINVKNYPEEHMDKLIYFMQDTFYIKNKEESKDLDTKQLEEIYKQCEEYDILNKPMLPKFNCPRGLSEEDYLKELCRDGWKKLLIEAGKVKDPNLKKVYADRFDKEFHIIKEANLFGYFLIVQDIIRYAQSEGWLTGPGRGSAAGSLLSYLIGITQIDPVEYDLLFERFYNAGRNTKDHISLPDIDIDVPTNHRDDVINYLKNKYGHDKVSQMITFGRLQGRSAIKEVLRVHEACSFAEMNIITKYIPNEAEISDQLAEMDEQDRSIIRWALINNSKELSEFCSIDENGKLFGDYAEYFQQAIDIEGTFKTQGRHAAGIVISSKPLNTMCPMVKSKDLSEKIAGLEMADLESLGNIKFDILGVTLLDKLMYIETVKHV